jgi:hypothetical protein
VINALKIRQKSGRNAQHEKSWRNRHSKREISRFAGSARQRRSNDGLERLIDKRPQGQAVTQSEDCLSPFCLHTSQISKQLQIAITALLHNLL